jgi:hypothetical protein
VGNYLIAKPSNLGNFMIADTPLHSASQQTMAVKCRVGTHPRSGGAGARQEAFRAGLGGWASGTVCSASQVDHGINY